jgi:flagellar export protein FliJ
MAGLQTVIWVKNVQVKQAQRELAVITSDREKEEKALGGLEDAQTDALEARKKGRKRKASDLQANQAFIDTLQRKISKQERKVQEIRSREERKREELVAKSQAEEMLEKIDGKRKVLVEKERERKAQTVIDAIAHRVRSKKP